jgi:chromosome partitioning protein
MRRIAIINQKGGVGKTTTTVNVGMALARSGQKVLMIDLDPQAHLSLHLGIDPAEGQAGTYEILTQSASFAKARQKVAQNLWVVNASIDLAAAEVELVSVVGREVILRDGLDQHVGAGKENHWPQYDYVLIDCPPSLGVLTLNGLCAANEVMIPLQPHYLALQGLGKLLETISMVAKRVNPELQVSGVVVCLYEGGTKLAAEVVQDVRDFFEQARGNGSPWQNTRVFDTVIRRNIKVAESPSYGQSIFDYAPDSNGAKDYISLAWEIIDPQGFDRENKPQGTQEQSQSPDSQPQESPDETSNHVQAGPSDGNGEKVTSAENNDTEATTEQQTEDQPRRSPADNIDTETRPAPATEEATDNNKKNDLPSPSVNDDNNQSHGDDSNDRISASA